MARCARELAQFSEKRLLPLWEFEDRIIAADLVKDPPEFVEFYRESVGEFESHGTSIFVPILRMIFLHVIEFGGGAQEAREAVSFATSIDFPFIEDLSEVINPETEWSEEAYQNLRATLSGQRGPK